MNIGAPQFRSDGLHPYTEMTMLCQETLQGRVQATTFDFTVVDNSPVRVQSNKKGK
jgi:hypothetical protein